MWIGSNYGKIMPRAVLRHPLFYFSPLEITYFTQMKFIRVEDKHLLHVFLIRTYYYLAEKFLPLN